MPPPSPPKLKRTLYTGTFVSTPTPSSLEVLEDYAIAVDEEGVLSERVQIDLSEEGSERDLEKWVKKNWDGWEWVDGGMGVGKGKGKGKGRGRWWFPGFVGECLGGFFLGVI